MKSKRDHGEGKNFPPNGAGAIAPAAGARAAAATTQAPPPAHPALVALVRLLAREAAAAWIAGDDTPKPTSENSREEPQAHRRHKAKIAAPSADHQKRGRAAAGQ